MRTETVETRMIADVSYLRILRYEINSQKVFQTHKSWDQ